MSEFGLKLVIATRNAGKVREFDSLAEGMGLSLRALSEFPNAPDPEETGSTFRENAVIKAKSAAAATNLWALADDSGLCVDALDGRPGIHSARYTEGTDQARWQKLLGEMTDVPEKKRQAAFVCALALAGPRGELFTTEGRCEGSIGHAPKGEFGFGYDPVFLIAGDVLGRTMAELSDAEKNEVSHRGHAFAQMRPHLAKLVLANSGIEAKFDHALHQARDSIAEAAAAVEEQIRGTGDLSVLLLRSASGDSLNDGEWKRVRAELIDLAKVVPSLAIFAAPGGMLLLPLVMKLLPFDIRPSAFKHARTSAPPPKR